MKPAAAVVQSISMVGKPLVPQARSQSRAKTSFSWKEATTLKECCLVRPLGDILPAFTNRQSF